MCPVGSDEQENNFSVLDKKRKRIWPEIYQEEEIFWILGLKFVKEELQIFTCMLLVEAFWKQATLPRRQVI